MLFGKFYFISCLNRPMFTIAANWCARALRHSDD